MSGRFIVAIPARYASSRLPGKPLRLLAGRPMIEHVCQRALASGAADVVVATDDVRIAEVVRALGVRAELTASTHPSGTDRLAELADRLNWADDEVVVNLQGDEPLMPPALLAQVAEKLLDAPAAGLATVATPIVDAEEWQNPNAVKVVLDAAGYALLFSRAPLPWPRDHLPLAGESWAAETPALRHIGLYAYRAATLRQMAAWGSCALERTEQLEQLRALWHGVRIAVAVVAPAPPAGVDTEQDLLAAERHLCSDR